MNARSLAWMAFAMTLGGCAGHTAVSTGDIDPVESTETAASRSLTMH